MTLRLDNIIVLVADMDRAVQFYRDQLGLTPITVSEYWSEFKAGAINIALHPGKAAEGSMSENGTHNGTLHLTFNLRYAGYLSGMRGVTRAWRHGQRTATARRHGHSHGDL